MKIEELKTGQYFILHETKHRAHSVSFGDRHEVYVETTSGTLLCERIGTWVEPATASTRVQRSQEWIR
jgi:hypothetical protein